MGNSLSRRCSSAGTPPLAKDFDQQDPGVGRGNADREDEGEREPLQSAASLRQQGGGGRRVCRYQQQGKEQPQVVGDGLDA
jgi:hypothetical protein